jgi:hypothetical protein
MALNHKEIPQKINKLTYFDNFDNFYGSSPDLETSPSSLELPSKGTWRCVDPTLPETDSVHWSTFSSAYVHYSEHCSCARL